MMRSKTRWTVKQSDDVKAKGTIRVLKLNRETLREMDAGEFGAGGPRRQVHHRQVHPEVRLLQSLHEGLRLAPSAPETGSRSRFS